MPNQLNYPTKLTTTEYQRPSRLEETDDQLISSGSQSILFGTHPRDNVEVWVYNPDGSFAGHSIVRPASGELALVTVVDTAGATELLNLDMKAISLDMGLTPGRYVMVLNFFRDEVGSETGDKFYISEISSDRTEVRLQLVNIDPANVADISEFILPSVPRQYAQALIDQSFGKSLDALPAEEITVDKVLDEMNKMNPDTASRIEYSSSINVYEMLVKSLINRTHDLVLDKMANDSSNLAIQENELMNYIEKSLDSVIYGMKQAGEIDPRFTVIG